MFKIRPGSYANVASTAALVVALGGTSYAATMITSHQIQDGTIQNRDIRPGTIVGDRIRDGGVALGDLAPDAQSAAYSVWHDAPVALPADGPIATVLTLTIPRSGKYVVNAKVEGYSLNGSSTWIYCSLSTSGDSDYSISSMPPNGATTLPLQVVHTFAAGDQAVMKCDTAFTSVTARNSKITAVSVDSLTNTAG